MRRIPFDWRTRILFGLTAFALAAALASVGPPMWVARPELHGGPTRILDRQAFHLRGDRIPQVRLGIDSLEALFEDLEYGLAEVRAGQRPVPRLFVAEIPPGLESIEDVDRRKRAFFRMMLPLILKVNEGILNDRSRVLRLRDQMSEGRPLAPPDADWLRAIADYYRLDADRVADIDFDRLLRRIDLIPPSLALAQAAEESGWGTSRFARQGNALFGQWTWGGEGIVPKNRAEDKTHRIKAYPSLFAAVRDYARNLNTHAAYRELRARRLAARRQDGMARGWDLAATLTSYSERGPEYVDSLHTIMRANDLAAFDRARLAPQLLVADLGAAFVPDRRAVDRN